MNLLHIETSSKNCSVAISQNGKLLSLCEEVSENYRQSERLHTFVEWALEGAFMKINEIDGVSIGMGPGSYTGLRIGTAAAKGFCFALKIPLIAINSLDTLVEPYIGQGYDALVPMIDARRMEVYTATYSGETGEMISPTEPLILDENSLQNLENKNVLFIGDGAKKASEILQISNATYISDAYPSAKYLVKRSFQKWNEKAFEDLAYFDPFYLKAFFTK